MLGLGGVGASILPACFGSCRTKAHCFLLPSSALNPMDGSWWDTEKHGSIIRRWLDCSIPCTVSRAAPQLHGLWKLITDTVANLSEIMSQLSIHINDGLSSYDVSLFDRLHVSRTHVAIHSSCRCVALGRTCFWTKCDQVSIRHAPSLHTARSGRRTSAHMRRCTRVSCTIARMCTLTPCPQKKTYVLRGMATKRWRCVRHTSNQFKAIYLGRDSDINPAGLVSGMSNNEAYLLSTCIFQARSFVVHSSSR